MIGKAVSTSDDDWDFCITGERHANRAVPRWRPPVCGRDTGVVTTTSLLVSILRWLRAGYPEGVPGPDRVPLLALLRSTALTEEQIEEVVRQITAGGSGEAIDHTEIAGFIADVTNRKASEEDIRRVACRLASGGWPLAGTSGTSL